MPNPKRRHSKTRRDKRRTHDKLTAKPLYLDPINGQPTVYHRVNIASGYYRGRKVMKGTDD
ncbi:MAG: 50S ribosomal protein L32 [Bacteroidia bacterium]|nr:50S ribosomal protein L32 [Bacteroidia bacterium]